MFRKLSHISFAVLTIANARNMNFNVVAICCTYNRREKSIRSVRQLLAQTIACEVGLTVMVVDNQSTDGTPEALRSLGPNVQVVSTPTDMYWSESMQFGFQQIDFASFDAVLAFNDDVDFDDSALARLIAVFVQVHKEKSRKVVIVASFRSDASNGVVTYGGFKRHSVLRPWLRRVLPGAGPVQIDTCNMNAVLISRECIEDVGFPDGPYRHSALDFDYGLKVTRMGAAVILAPGVYGVCERNAIHGTWRDTELTLSERWRLMRLPKGRPLLERWHFLRRNFSLLESIFVLTPIIQLISDEVRRTLYRARRVMRD